jgi:hypothetical protein
LKNLIVTNSIGHLRELYFWIELANSVIKTEAEILMAMKSTGSRLQPAKTISLALNIFLNLMRGRFFVVFRYPRPIQMPDTQDTLETFIQFMSEIFTLQNCLNTTWGVPGCGH